MNSVSNASIMNANVPKGKNKIELIFEACELLSICAYLWLAQ